MSLVMNTIPNSSRVRRTKSSNSARVCASIDAIWEAAQTHLRELSTATGESCSIAQLDGSDVVYLARVAVPKLVTLSVTIGTRFPAAQTSLGKVLLAALPRDELEVVLGIPSRSGITPAATLDRARLDDELRRVRAQGWAVTDQQLGPAIRSIAAPVRNGSGFAFLEAVPAELLASRASGHAIA